MSQIYTNTLMEENSPYQYQLTQLKIIKLEYEVEALKAMVFKNLATQHDTEYKEMASKFDSFNHDAMLEHFDSICASLPLLEPALIRQHLKLDDQ